MKAYILAGGESRRMGRAKHELMLGGRDFLRRVISAADPVFEEVVIVARSQAPFGSAGRRVIEEPAHEGTSPLFGINAALADARGDAWIIGVDYPLLSSALLEMLAARFIEARPDLLVPVWSARPQMLCAGYGGTLRGEIDRRIENREFMLRGLIDYGRSIVIHENEIRLRFAGEPLRNVNTPEEYEEILALERQA